MNIFQRIALVIVILFFFILTGEQNGIEFPTFRVVLDPGHGGNRSTQKKKDGDRYDKVTKKYLTKYNAGARYRGIEEHAIAYSIAKKVKELLDLTATKEDFSKFAEIIKRFTFDKPKRVIIHAKLSRADSSNRQNISKLDDPNAGFRLFDYPDKTGKICYGRISKINKYKPHLIVSLHLDLKPPIYYRGINPVIAAPYSFLYSGLQYQKGNIKSKKFFFQTPYANWFTESVKRTGFKWFLNDTSIYFTGFPLKKSGRVDTNRFLGYRHNMVSWIYKDPNQWENKAKKHKKNTQYAKFCKDFVPEGVFWKRERSKYESFRREGGIEGYGGDNLFASTELIRYILFSLFLNGNHHPSQKLGHPYISTWSLPILVNAITAYIELGYLSIKRDRWILTNKQNEIAEGIAVGIYSLLVGLKPKNKKFKYGPIGKSIDLSKYNLSTGESYFEIVVPE